MIYQSTKGTPTDKHDNIINTHHIWELSLIVTLYSLYCITRIARVYVWPSINVVIVFID